MPGYQSLRGLHRVCPLPETNDSYNLFSFLQQPCDSDCPPCADCLARFEQDLAQLGQRPECDCSREYGVDPCSFFSSCGCYCLRYNSLIERCPHFATQPLSGDDSNP
eukprot:g8724.t1